MRWIPLLLGRGWLVVCVGLLGACGEAGGAPAAAVASAKQVPKNESGLRFTIDGPAFGGPATFTVPGSQDLIVYVGRGMFSLSLPPNKGITSEDGKHRLETVVIGTEPGGKGEFTERSGMKKFTLSFVTNAGTPASQSVSMSFKYSKGTPQPARLVLDEYDSESDKGGAAGHFQVRLQRTNNKSTDQFYEASGAFRVPK